MYCTTQRYNFWEPAKAAPNQKFPCPCCRTAKCVYLFNMQSWYQQALNSFFPEVCIHCGEKQQHVLLLCTQCLIELPQQLHTIPSPELLQNLWGLAEYDGPIGSIIRRCKYKPDQRIIRVLVQFMRTSAVPWNDFDIITHVPTTFSRRFSRGFDQAQLLAQKLSASTTIPYQQLLRRVDPKAQSSRTYEERKTNLSFRFSCRAQPPETVLLIDDVCTTGSTLESCAMTLLNNGATSVSGIVLGY